MEAGILDRMAEMVAKVIKAIMGGMDPPKRFELLVASPVTMPKGNGEEMEAMDTVATMPGPAASPPALHMISKGRMVEMGGKVEMAAGVAMAATPPSMLRI